MKGRPNEGVTARAELRGRVRLDVATGWLVDFDLTGPIVLKGRAGAENSKTEFEADGKLTMGIGVRYSKQK
jgi:hypothetical protein